MCSYCGCRSIEVIGRYSAEHEEIVNRLGELRRHLETDPAGAAAHLAAMLTPHTRSEERSLFARLREDPDFTEHVDSLCAEHTHLDEMLEVIAAGDASNYHEFEIALRNHMDREENGLFPAAAIALDGPDWEWIHEQA